MKIDFHLSGSVVLNGRRENFQCAKCARTHGSELVSGVGGGSVGVIDLAFFTFASIVCSPAFSSHFFPIESGNNFTSENFMGDFSSPIFWLIRLVSMVTHKPSVGP